MNGQTPEIRQGELETPLEISQTPEREVPGTDIVEEENDIRFGEDRYSIGAMLHKSFKEIDENGPMPELITIPQEIREKPTREVYLAVLKRMFRGLRESPLVRKVRMEVKKDENGYENISRPEKDGLLRVYDRERDDAFQKVEMSDKQRKELKSLRSSQLDFQYRSWFREGKKAFRCGFVDPFFKLVERLSKKKLSKYIGRSSLSIDTFRKNKQPDKEKEAAETLKTDLGFLDSEKETGGKAKENAAAVIKEAEGNPDLRKYLEEARAEAKKVGNLERAA
jgi:hypothetical protein